MLQHAKNRHRHRRQKNNPAISLGHQFTCQARNLAIPFRGNAFGAHAGRDCRLQFTGFREMSKTARVTCARCRAVAGYMMDGRVSKVGRWGQHASHWMVSGVVCGNGFGGLRRPSLLFQLRLSISTMPPALRRGSFLRAWPLRIVNGMGVRIDCGKRERPELVDSARQTDGTFGTKTDVVLPESPQVVVDGRFQWRRQD